MGSVWPPMVVECDPRPDGGLCLRPGLSGVQVDAFVFRCADLWFRDRRRRSIKTVSMQRPLPSIEIRVATRFNRSVQAKDVNRLP